MAAIRFKRGTRAQLNTAAAANSLAQGEPYLISDESRVAVGTAASSYKAFVREDDAVVAPQTHAAASKTTPADADELPLVDSAASNVLKKLTFANLKATLLAYFLGQFREKLTADRTYYVRTDGSDSNTGLSNTSVGAFLTIQKAVDIASAFDLNGFTVTIQLGDGTYTGVVAGKAYVGQGLISIDGNAATPGNVVVSTASTSFNMSNCGSYRLRNFRVQASAGYAIFANGARTALTLSGMVYGAMSASGTHIYVTAQASVVQNSAAYSILGGGYSHITVSEGGTLESSLCTVTLTGTPAFSNYAFVENLSLCRLVSNTYSGSATGARYSVSGSSVIFTAGAGATALPGNSAGSATTGGQYL